MMTQKKGSPYREDDLRVGRAAYEVIGYWMLCLSVKGDMMVTVRWVLEHQWAADRCGGGARLLTEGR